MACALIAGTAIAHAAGFGFDDVALQAQTLAQTPWRKPTAPDARRAALDYDAVRRIQFRQPQALWRGTGSPFEMQFFPVAGEYVVRALALHEVTDGNVRALKLPASIFDNDGVLPPDAPGAAALIAGWKITYPLNVPGKKDEVAAFLGSNYFRALGQGQRYGLSARALAIDTVGGANGRVVRSHVYPNGGRNSWRATLEFDRLDAKQAVELRVFLRQGANTLSETWSYAMAPD